MKKQIINLVIVTFAMVMLLSAIPAYGESPGKVSPVGFWKTIDDETGKEKSIVHIWSENGTLTGKIEKLFREPGEEPDPVCDECKGENKDKPIKGMIILWDLTQDDDWWTGGHILDPGNGKVYQCKLQTESGSDELTVRGYIGFSLLGRSQTWIRVKE